MKRNIKYWQNEGAQKTFTHEIEMEWIENINKASQILDLGCGYGRITTELYKKGFENIIGFDPSVPLIERAINENPGPVYTADEKIFERIHFDLIICFAIFTSCPANEEQAELKKLIDMHTIDGALIYISDCITADNPHYNERYEERKLSTYGCFASGENGIFRHHELNHFDDMFSNWTKLKEHKVDSKTFNRNDIIISQYLYKKG